MNIYSWDEPGIGRALAYMSTVAVVFLVILWIIEYRIISIIGRCFRRSSSRPSRIHVVSNALDSDVINEKNKVNSMSPEEVESNNLVLQNLTKVYGKFIAVKGISVAVKRCVICRLVEVPSRTICKVPKCFYCILLI